MYYWDSKRESKVGFMIFDCRHNHLYLRHINTLRPLDTTEQLEPLYKYVLFNTLICIQYSDNQFETFRNKITKI